MTDEKQIERGIDYKARFRRLQKSLQEEAAAHLEKMERLDRIRGYVEDRSMSDEDARLYIAGVLDDRVAR